MSDSSSGRRAPGTGGGRQRERRTRRGQQREKRERLDYGIQRLQEMGVSLDPKEYDYPDDYQMPPSKKQCSDESKEYPNTDTQYSVYDAPYEAPSIEGLPEDYAGAGPLTPAQMAQQKEIEKERRKQAMAAQRLAQEASDREAAATNLDALLDKIGGGGGSSGTDYASEHRQELFDQQQAAAEAQPMVGAWGYYSSNYQEAQQVHRGQSKPQHPAAGYV